MIAKTSYFRVACLLTALALVLVLFPMSTVTPRAKSVEELQQEQEELRDRIEELEGEKDALSDSLEDQQIRLGIINEQVQSKQREILLNQQQIDAKDEEINAKLAEIAAREAEIAHEFDYLKKRLNQVSKTGNLSEFQMVLSTENYVDYLIKSKVMKAIAANDEKTIRALEGEIGIINKQKDELQAQRDELGAKQKEMEALKVELDKLYDEVATAVANLEADIDYYRNQIAISKDEEAELEAAIAEKLAQGDNNQAFKTGSMYWPSTQCTILTSTYGYRWGRLHKGIDIACSGDAHGKDIIPAADGVVLDINDTYEYGYGWSSGYGYCVLVDHGLDEYGRRVVTMYAHMSKVLVTPGQYVVGGKTRLGDVGNTGESYGAHIHFEVRLDGVPVDPLGNGYVAVP